jgi:cell division protein ZapA
MASLTINICGRAYDIACEEGQEEHVTRLAHAIDHKAQGILQQVGQVGESRLLVMLCLVLQDELVEAKAAGPVSSSSVDKTELLAETESARVALVEGLAKLDGQVADGLDALAVRVEAIADRLGRA